MRQQVHIDPSGTTHGARQAGVLTMTGLLPSPLKEPTAPASHSQRLGTPARRQSPKPLRVSTPSSFAHALFAHAQRPAAFRLAGLETYERLQNVARLSCTDLLARAMSRASPSCTKASSRPVPLCADLRGVPTRCRLAPRHRVHLEPTATQAVRGEQVAKQLRGYLDTVVRQPDVAPTLCVWPSSRQSQPELLARPVSLL